MKDLRQDAFCHCGGEDSERHGSKDKLESHVDRRGQIARQGRLTQSHAA